MGFGAFCNSQVIAIMPILQTFGLQMIEFEPKPLANPFVGQRSFGAWIKDMEIDDGLDIEDINVTKHPLRMKKKANSIYFILFSHFLISFGFDVYLNMM
jgi:hypothetical protein